jgi:IMP and pyridine-specific 5'-nucleotidase
MSKLKLLVPTVGIFFTPLSLSDAFVYQDARRFISWRRFVAPSFNDIRLMLNTAQVMSLARGGPLDLVTFDGDVTLYDDGAALEPDSPLVPRLLALLARGTRVAIVTAAGYTQASRYHERLHGLLDAVATSDLPPALRDNLIVLGGESNYMYRFSDADAYRLEVVPRADWMLDEMRGWREDDISALLDLAEAALKECVRNFRLSAQVVRKDRCAPPLPDRTPPADQRPARWASSRRRARTASRARRSRRRS